MDRELLYRFFKGQTHWKEEMEIRRWLEASEENEKIFYNERLTYDALILTSPTPVKKQKQTRYTLLWICTSAAAVVLLCLISRLVFFELKNTQEQYCTVYVPAGQRINLVLPDSTSVWLNANTEFKYPTLFSGKNRTVYLDGEAYFDVTHDKDKSFIVQTEHGSIFVTGTTFNVESFSQKDWFETSLFTGSLDVYIDHQTYVSLKPNEKSTYKSNRLEIAEITDTDKYLWRRGLIAFSNKKLEEILASFERSFEVAIRVDTTLLPQHTYTGKFRQSDGVDYALRVLQKSIRFTYERDDENRIIHIK